MMIKFCFPNYTLPINKLTYKSEKPEHNYQGRRIKLHGLCANKQILILITWMYYFQQDIHRKFFSCYTEHFEIPVCRKAFPENESFYVTCFFLKSLVTKDIITKSISRLWLGKRTDLFVEERVI